MICHFAFAFSEGQLACEVLQNYYSVDSLKFL